MRAGRATTLADVARIAGVSVATASKALNDRDRVADATRARVSEVATRLGFLPNPAARSLQAGRTSTVGMLIRDSRVERFAVPVMVGAEQALTDIDLSLIVCDAHGDRARTAALLANLRQRKVDGVLIVGDNTGLHESLSDRIDVPVVYAYNESQDAKDVAHLPDDFQGAGLVVDHLVAAGRRRIAHLTGPRRSRAVSQRADGVRAALRSAHLRIAAPVVYGQWSQRWGRRATAQLLRDVPDIDAIVCGSDQIASGALDALLDAGRDVPNEVAVTGFDNWVEFAEDAQPALTTVDMNLTGLGAAAARELFRLIDGTASVGGVRRHPCSLVVRASAP